MRDVPRRYADLWARPWTRKAKYHPAFRLWLHRQGLLSPHFSYTEAACKDGTQIPRRLRTRARHHAFNLERLRHELGDVPIPVTSWYRTPEWNRKVGGADRSKHMQAIATDIDATFVDHVGRGRFLGAVDRVFVRGGIGTYPGGSVHTDSRLTRARWSTWTPGR